MTAKKLWVIVASIAFCIVFLYTVGLAISPQEEAQIQAFGVSTLSGLKGVLLALSLHVADGVECSLSVDELQTQVELTLRRNGIEFFTTNTSEFRKGRIEEHIKTDQNDLQASALKQNFGLDFGSLNVNVTIHPALPDSSIYVVMTEVEFRQLVSLFRNPKIFTHAITWPIHTSLSHMTYHSSKIEQGIKEQVDKRLAEFCNDFLAANPKQQSAEEKGKKKDD